MNKVHLYLNSPLQNKFRTKIAPLQNKFRTKIAPLQNKFFTKIKFVLHSIGKRYKYKVNLIIDFPFESEITAVNEEEAIDKAMDKAMEYLESRLSDSHKFDEFWEYQIQHKILEVKKNQLNQA